MFKNLLQSFYLLSMLAVWSGAGQAQQVTLTAETTLEITSYTGVFYSGTGSFGDSLYRSSSYDEVTSYFGLNSTSSVNASPNTKPYGYYNISITPQVTGRYVIGIKNSRVDTLLYLHNQPFSPNNFALNFIGGNDDFASGYGTTSALTSSFFEGCPNSNLCPATEFDLEVGTVYYLTVSHYDTVGYADFFPPLQVFTYGPASTTLSDTTSNKLINIATPVAGNNVIDATEVDAVQISGAVSNISDGETITVTVTDQASASVSGSATVASGNWSVSGLDLQSLANGSLTIQASTTTATTPSSLTVVLDVPGSDNTPPVITGPIGASGSTTAATAIMENTTAIAQMTATDDVSASGNITWSLSGADSALFTIASDGTLTFATAPDFEAPADNGDTANNNTYEVVIKATDEMANVVTQTLTVTVLDLDENAPLITGPSGSAGDATSAINVDENQTAVTTLTADESCHMVTDR